MALALGEDRDQHIGAGHLVAPRGLDMDHGALDDALEARRRLRFLDIVDDEIGELVVDIALEIAAQDVDVDAAGAHDGGGILVVGQSEKQMLERRIFVAALIGDGERAMESFL